MHPSRTQTARRTRAGAVLIALAVTLVACSDDGNSADTTVGVSTTTAPTASPATTSAAPSTTSAPTSTVAETTTTEAVTTTTVPGPPVYPLTGVLVADPVIAARQALVVKIDNANGARPQTGFNNADIVFEEIVNDNLTRFAMIFQSNGSSPVGPIRSGRIQDINLFGSLDHPLFSWSGGNKTVTDAIRASDLLDIGPSRAAVYFRSKDRKAPHNLYSSTDALWTQSPIFSPAPPQQFVYRADGAPVAGSPSQGVNVKLDSIDVEWRWNAATGLYERKMEGKAHMDAGSGQVTTNNVVVLAMTYLPGISHSPDAQTIGTGEVWVFTAGNSIHGTWSREDRLNPFTLTADDGTPIALTPGRTFIELPRNDFGMIAPQGA